MISRRQFLQTTAAGLVLPPFWQARPSGSTFYIGVIADSHIIDSYYKGPESNPEDTESIFKTTERLTSARNLLNSLTPALDRVFLVGDYFHDYPSADLDFYFANTTRIDHAKALTDGFRMPVHVGFGQRVISGHWHRWVDAGTEYGPKHLVIGATRYDPDAYLILEIDTVAGAHRALNLDLVEWNTHFSRPYVSSAP